MVKGMCAVYGREAAVIGRARRTFGSLYMYDMFIQMPCVCLVCIVCACVFCGRARGLHAYCMHALPPQPGQQPFQTVNPTTIAGNKQTRQSLPISHSPQRFAIDESLPPVPPSVEWTKS